MKQLMVVTNTPFGSGLAGNQDIAANIGDLNVGALSLLRNEANELIARTAAGDALGGDLGDKEYVNFVLNEGGELVLSNQISPDFSWEATPYAAPVAQVGAIGGVAVSTLPAVADINLYLGGYLSLYIVNLSMAVEDQRRYKRYEVLIQVGDTIASLVTDLVAEVNADPDRIVNAAVVSVVEGDEEISLTARTAGVGFAAYGGDLMEEMPVDDGAAATVIVGNSEGSGLAHQLSEYSRMAATHVGWNPQSSIQSNLHSRPVDVPIPAVGDGYDVYVLKWKHLRDDKLGTVDAKPEQELLIAVSEAAAFDVFRVQLETVLEIIRTRANAAFV